MGFNRKVVRQQGLGFTTLDFNALRKQQVERDQMLAEAAKLENERLNEEKISYERDAALKANHRALMKNYRGAGINALAASIPNAILAECFNTVFVKALPHDTDYVDENIKTIKNMGAMYVKKIGGVKALAESANRTNSPFLRTLLEFCNEFSQAIIMERVKEINEAETEEEIKEMISPQLNDEERNTILVKMDKLGSDELAEMISNKVIDVVRDEQQREKDQAEILDTMEKDMNEDPNDVKVDDREDTTADDVAEAAKHVAETYNPLTRTFNYDKKDTNKSFFFSLMQGIATKVLKESTQTESTKVETPQVLLENPLNLNIFDVYMQDKNEDLDDLRRMDMTDTGEIARTTSLDKDFILSEALLQYTMFETAHTMKLVNITLDDIRQQADYMRKGC
jgi:hypothetical protein|nr:MAG TPA: hypothetical protein [Caudoviricetes sp.]